MIPAIVRISASRHPNRRILSKDLGDKNSPEVDSICVFSFIDQLMMRAGSKEPCQNIVSFIYFNPNTQYNPEVLSLSRIYKDLMGSIAKKSVCY